MLHIQLRDLQGRPIVVAEVIVRKNVVEVKCENDQAMASRSLLAKWLAAPQGSFEFDAVTFTHVGAGVVTVSIEGIALAQILDRFVLRDLHTVCA